MNASTSREDRRVPAAAKAIVVFYLVMATFVAIWGTRTGLGGWTALLVVLWIVAGTMLAWRITRSRNR